MRRSLLFSSDGRMRRICRWIERVRTTHHRNTASRQLTLDLISRTESLSEMSSVRSLTPSVNRIVTLLVAGEGGRWEEEEAPNAFSSSTSKARCFPLAFSLSGLAGGGWSLGVVIRSSWSWSSTRVQEPCESLFTHPSVSVRTTNDGPNPTTTPAASTSS